jgi:hypothetical protein
MAYHLRKTAVLMTTLLLAGASQAATMGKDEYHAAKDRISAEYKQDKAACKQSSGNAKDICEEQAKGKEKVARAELEYSYSGKPADATKVEVAKADAAYEVAKERCDDMAGNPKSVCVSEAKAAHTKALADAKMAKKVETAHQDAATDKADADFKVAREKCDALAGDAQSSCINAAKARYGKS